ncbi:hypothetical protein OF83DRAFT_296283 [Amylostereum chailletii]|nr:hypothetical protein OF83DRAFT_296283 [Amylostereum chailletii]
MMGFSPFLLSPTICRVKHLPPFSESMTCTPGSLASPISTLHSEPFGRISPLLAATDTEVLPCSLVCNRQRAAALTYTELWTTVPVSGNPGQTVVYLEHSESMPIFLTIDHNPRII